MTKTETTTETEKPQTEEKEHPFANECLRRIDEGLVPAAIDF